MQVGEASELGGPGTLDFLREVEGVSRVDGHASKDAVPGVGL